MNLSIPNINISDGNNKEIVDVLHRYRKELNFLLMNLDESNMPGIASRLDGMDGSFSLINQEIDSITLAVGNNSGDISSLQLTAEGIQTQVSNNEGDISTLTQTVDGIQTTVSSHDSLLGTHTSQITQLSNEISLKVSASYVNGEIDDLDDSLTGAEIALRVNSAGSSIKIEADHIELDGITRIYDVNSSSGYVEFIGNQLQFNGVGNNAIIFGNNASIWNYSINDDLGIGADGDILFTTSGYVDFSNVGNIDWGTNYPSATYA